MRIAASLGLLLVASVAYAQKVNVDFHQSAPFDTYKTYTWTQGTPARSSLAERYVHAEVDAQLGAKGLSPADAGAPDLFVATHVVTRQQHVLIGNEFGWGLRTSPVRYSVGTLIVDLYDATTRQLVWRGVGSHSVGVKPRRNLRQIFEALDKMFDTYPPE